MKSRLDVFWSRTGLFHPKEEDLCCSSDIWIDWFIQRETWGYIYTTKSKLIGINLILCTDTSGFILMVRLGSWSAPALISQQSPSGSLCWEGDTGLTLCRQASVTPLKNLRGKLRWKERLRFHVCCLRVSNASIYYFWAGRYDNLHIISNVLSGTNNKQGSRIKVGLDRRPEQYGREMEIPRAFGRKLREPGGNRWVMRS